MTLRQDIIENVSSSGTALGRTSRPKALEKWCVFLEDYYDIELTEGRRDSSSSTAFAMCFSSGDGVTDYDLSLEIDNGYTLFNYLQPMPERGQTDNISKRHLAMMGTSNHSEVFFMVQAELTVRKRRRHRKGPLYRLVRCLFPLSALLFGAAVCMAVIMPVEDRPVEPPALNIPVSNEPTSNITTHTTPESSAAAETWKLVLVNFWNPLPDNYFIQTAALKNGFQVDERCYPDLQAMMDACRADGLSPVICSAYRSWENQERLYQAEVKRWLDRGYSQGRAEAEVGKAVALPGASEHQLGLAVDIVDLNNQHLDETQESTEVQKWLMEHSWEYGFILRYPNEKSEITGIIYEPWHYRYVGREDAEQIHASGLCLEEYLEGTF